MKPTFENRQRLLKYKRDLEIELLRVNASLESGTEVKFKRNNLWLGPRRVSFNVCPVRNSIKIKNKILRRAVS